MPHLPQMLSFLAAFALMSTAAHAANKQELYEIHGIGTDSCGQWAQNRRYDSGPTVVVSQQTFDLWAEKNWVMGFLSAYNDRVWKGKDVASETDNNGIFAWIDTYCAANPLKSLAGATEALVDTMAAGPHRNDK